MGVLKKSYITAGLGVSASALLTTCSMIQYEHHWVERVTYESRYGGYLAVQTPFTSCGAPKSQVQRSFQVPPAIDGDATYWYTPKFLAKPGLPISRDEALTLGLSQAIKIAIEHSLLGTGRPCGFGW